MTRALALALGALVVASIGCGGGGDDTSDGISPKSGDVAIAHPDESPCDGKACSSGFAGVELVNKASDTRRVFVDGELTCVLEPGASCDTSIDAGSLTTIHVTEDDGATSCSSDPTLTLAECVCATVSIDC